MNITMNYIWEFFSDVGIADVIDVAIIATFIYMALVWFEKARARFMMIGLFILGSIYILARFFGLYLTTVVFQAFFAVFLIMLVIIFQDEFRHFFERIALWGIIRKKRRFTAFNQNVDIITNALADLSRKKIGALVVIKGNDPLERHIEGGIPLGGVLSQIILESIFDPHVPSHDGAVIIEDGGIVKFGCHLPLSMNIQKVGYSGTRHAAALGLAERTDALCIVVSEEQGTISIADGERIKPLKDIAGLRLRLEDFYCKRFPRRKRFRLDLLTGHILEKIIAIVLACGLWMLFSYRQEIVRRDFVVPIEYRNLAPDWIIGEPKAKEATAALSGTERAFNLMDPKELKMSLDMSQVKEGINEFLLTKDLVRYPSGISMVSITPARISLKIYKMITLDVPIEVKTSGRVSFGLALRNIEVHPQTVSIVVPSIIPRQQIKIVTEDIDLRSIRETEVLTPKLIVPREVRFVDDKYPEVKVTVEIEKKNVKKVVSP